MPNASGCPPRLLELQVRAILLDTKMVNIIIVLVVPPNNAYAKYLIKFIMFSKKSVSSDKVLRKKENCR